jgi:hypothetical protein
MDFSSPAQPNGAYGTHRNSTDFDLRFSIARNPAFAEV